MYTYRKSTFIPPAEYLVFIINAMYKSSVFLTVHIFMSVHSCLDLQRPILRHKLAVTDLNHVTERKESKNKIKVCCVRECRTGVCGLVQLAW